ncbi:MAG: dCTP deaminase [Rhizomicrobium sp.]
MLLSDTDINARLGELNVATDNPNFPFDPNRQVQPCSIDLRLSPVIWVPRRFRRVDLMNNTPLGPQITSAFKKKNIGNRGYLLRPGRFVLGSTYESFDLPTDLCGRLVGRSSLGRLGLSAAGTANFINPGWRGRMPVVLVNHSLFSVRVHPYLGIVQLCLTRLASAPTKVYGQGGLGSKYIDDDGGPSRYWLDYTVETLRRNLQLKNTNANAEAYLESFSKQLDEATCARFLKRVNSIRFVADGPDFVSGFVRIEGRRVAKTWAIGIGATLVVSPAINFCSSLSQMGLPGFAILATMAAVAFAGYVWAYLRYCGTSMSTGELRAVAQNTKNV